ncbi:LysM peptidoglycan-binding domain-containing protein [Ornithinimicrobium sp. INDO-MA30-4]|uniref:LysM peptidoglycan-binding domain-containing protein n=1 Tax=Ornithinimicrobium sp. INDO-MA30-4 TaxID=2908651 RepID=UPI001F407E6B|nr:LysM peptidoglycan-binding domain-containing protein [Ornithinimicrobium sp. INDO-MA30-4]UJH71409.1 LysM peptidoglycan-binding domain-containing protein [Ornithinimicrobium sp. INDO-MA30-4]
MAITDAQRWGSEVAEVATAIDVGVATLTGVAALASAYLAVLLAVAIKEVRASLAPVTHLETAPQAAAGLTRQLAQGLAASLLLLLAGTSSAHAAHEPSPVMITVASASNLPSTDTTLTPPPIGSMPQLVPAPTWTPAPMASSVRLIDQGCAVDDEVVVRRGDTLWSLAEQNLGPMATAQEVALAWPAWHEANRSVIGPDPHMIYPGQVLRPPTSTASTQPSQLTWSSSPRSNSAAMKDHP